MRREWEWGEQQLSNFLRIPACKGGVFHTHRGDQAQLHRGECVAGLVAQPFGDTAVCRPVGQTEVGMLWSECSAGKC